MAHSQQARVRTKKRAQAARILGITLTQLKRWRAEEVLRRAKAIQRELRTYERKHPERGGDSRMFY